MVTNFNHIKKWKKMFDSAVEMEDSLLAATTELKYKKAIGASRDVVEHMTKEFTKAAGMTDQDVLNAMEAAGKGGRYPTNYGRILAIKSTGILSQESLNNMFFLNTKGNAGNHTDSELDKMSLEDIKALAENVYEKLYRETYLFAHQYIPIIEAQKTKGISTKKPGTQVVNSADSGSGSGIVWLLIIGVILVFGFFFLRMIMFL